ncbi:hypothetical protein PENTCL1PPCAC_2, partial [Pristionchus entomophagus]
RVCTQLNEKTPQVKEDSEENTEEEEMTDYMGSSALVEGEKGIDGSDGEEGQSVKKLRSDSKKKSEYVTSSLFFSDDEDDFSNQLQVLEIPRLMQPFPAITSKNNAPWRVEKTSTKEVLALDEYDFVVSPAKRNKKEEDDEEIRALPFLLRPAALRSRIFYKFEI